MSPDEVICPQCGNSIPKNTPFCSFCGAKVSVEQVVQSPLPPVANLPPPVAEAGINAPYQGAGLQFVVPPPVAPQPPSQVVPYSLRTTENKACISCSGFCVAFFLLGILGLAYSTQSLQILVGAIVCACISGVALLFAIFLQPHYSGQISPIHADTSRLIPVEVRQQVMARDGGRCVRCGSPQALKYDYILPLSKGGANTVQNLRLLCANCSSLKQD